MKRNFFDKIRVTLAPYLIIALGVALFIAAFFVFSYVFVFLLIIAMILAGISYIRARFFQAKQKRSTKAHMHEKPSGRVIDQHKND